MTEPNPLRLDALAREFATAAAQAMSDVQAVASELGDAALRRADLVTREEFEIQRELLTRARAQLDRIERRLDELEQLGKG